MLAVLPFCSRGWNSRVRATLVSASQRSFLDVKRCAFLAPILALGCSSWDGEAIGTTTNSDTSAEICETATSRQCKGLGAGTFEVWAFYSAPLDYESPTSIELTPGMYELDSWRLWVTDDLSMVPSGACKELMFASQFATPRMQILWVSEARNGVHRVALRTDFPESQEVSSLEFDARFERSLGAYTPVAEQCDSQPRREDWLATWYGVQPSLVDAGVRLIGGPNDLVVEVPFQGHAFCGVIEHYVPVGEAVPGVCIPPDPCKSRRR